jgi:hypothetical protein
MVSSADTILFLPGVKKMKIIISFFMALTVVCFVGLSDACAAGIGLYGSLGGGTADWSPDSGNDFRKSARHQSFGFALDTAPVSDNFFNYNLNLGYEQFTNTNDKAWGKADLTGLLFSSCFGFGGKLTRDTRLWLGPELRLEWVDGKPDGAPNFTVRLFGIGFGPVIGLNVKAGDHFTFVVKTGYQAMHYYGYGRGPFSHISNTVSSSSNRYDYGISEKLYYVTLEILAIP